MRSRGLVFTFGLLTASLAAGYGVMFAVLDDFRDEYGISEAALGLVVAVGFFSSFLAQVLFAPQADRGHARRLVILGVLFNLVGLVMMAFGHTVEILLLGRVMMGIGTGMTLPAARRIVILADPDNLGHNIGRLLVADVFGFAIGPTLSAVLVGPGGLAAPFLVIGVLSLVCLAVVYRVEVDEASAEDAPPARFAFDLLRIRPVAGAICFGMAAFLMIGTFDALWVLVLDDLDSPKWIGTVGITLFALPMIFLGSLGGRLAQRVGPFRLATLGMSLGAVFMLLYGQVPTGMAMFVVSMVHSLNDATTISASGVAVGMTAPKDRLAGAQGMLGGAQTLIGGISAIMAGTLYEHHGRAVAYGACAALMAVLIVAGLWLAGPAWLRHHPTGPIAEEYLPEHVPMA